MKYLPIILILLTSCNYEYSHIRDKGVVKEVRQNSSGYYEVRVKNLDWEKVKTNDIVIVDKEYYFYTESLYQVGDTVIIKKK